MHNKLELKPRPDALIWLMLVIALGWGQKGRQKPRERIRGLLSYLLKMLQLNNITEVSPWA
jgi:hypothetical protein